MASDDANKPHLSANSNNNPLRNILKNDVFYTTIPVDTTTYTTISNQVQRLGGQLVTQYTGQETTRITHLISTNAGDTIHRDICETNQRTSLADRILIVQPTWLESCQNAGVRVNAQPYLLPPLTGFEICCTGLDIEQKDHIENLVVDLGGKYNKVLSMKCTHLICNEPTGKKYEHAVNHMPHIFIIRPKWIEQCGKLHTLVNESPYKLVQDVRREDNQAGINHNLSKVTASIVNPTVLNTLPNTLPIDLPNHRAKATEPDKPTSNDDKIPLDALKIYLTESPMHESNKHAPLRTKALTLAAHAGATILPDAISSTVNFIIVLTNPIKSSTKPAIKLANDSGIPIVSLKFLEDCVKHGYIMAPYDEYVLEDWENNNQHRSLSQSMSQMERNKRGSQNEDVVPNSTIFRGLRVSLGPLWLRDEHKCSGVEQQLLRGKANILTHDSYGKTIIGTPTHLVCPCEVKGRERALIERTRQKENQHLCVVTPFWIESCSALQTLLPVDDCVLFAPLQHAVPLRCMVEKRVCVTISGFQQRHERDWNRRREVLSRVVELVGAKYSDKLRRKSTTHVVADGRAAPINSHKPNKAREWGIHVVTHEWLLASVRAGSTAKETEYQWTAPPPVSANDDDEDDDMHYGGTLATQKTPEKVGRHGSRRKAQSEDAKAISLFQRLNEGLGGSRSNAESNGADEFGKTLQNSNDDDDQQDDDDDDNADDDDDDDDDDAKDGAVLRGSGRRSRSNSRDAIVNNNENSWSMDASQSQLIQHRDLTPPPTPKSKAVYGRGMSTRSSKRARTE